MTICDNNNDKHDSIIISRNTNHTITTCLCKRRPYIGHNRRVIQRHSWISQMVRKFLFTSLVAKKKGWETKLASPFLRSIYKSIWLIDFTETAKNRICCSVIRRIHHLTGDLQWGLIYSNIIALNQTGYSENLRNIKDSTCGLQNRNQYWKQIKDQSPSRSFALLLICSFHCQGTSNVKFHPTYNRRCLRCCA